MSFNDSYEPFVIEMNQNIFLSPYHIDIVDNLLQKITIAMLDLVRITLDHADNPNEYFASENFATDAKEFVLLYNESTGYSVID